MLSTLSKANLFKLKAQPYVIDSWMTKFHYRATTALLILSTILVTSTQYIGDAINCISDKGVDNKVLNTYCFISSTFTVTKHHNTSSLQKGEISHLGVGQYSPYTDEPIKVHAYYQWVPFVLFWQALMFYAPHYIWKKLEGGSLKQLSSGLKNAKFGMLDKDITVGKANIPSKSKTASILEKIRDVFIQHALINKWWSTKMVICEMLYILNLALQIYLTDLFLGGQFIQLGFNILLDGSAHFHLVELVFPKVTKCNFFKYGPSGTIQFHDAMCVMAINIINEKIYVFLWFWYIVLAAVSFLGIFFTVISICCHSRSDLFNKWTFSSRGGRINPWEEFKMTYLSKYSDWLFMYYLSKNIDALTFRDLFVGIAKKMEEEDRPFGNDKSYIDV